MTQAPERNWWDRNWKWVLPAGCLAGIVCVAGLVAFILGIVFGVMRSSDVYKEALARAQASPAVAEALGTPIKAGYFTSGNINVSGPSGDANLSIPISGPKGKATIYLEARKSAGEWSFSLLEVEIAETEERIDLLQPLTSPKGSSQNNCPTFGCPCQVFSAVYSGWMYDETAIRRRFELLEENLDERMRRLFAAAEAEALGFGGASVVARATGISRRTINRGLKELRQVSAPRSPARRTRRPGGGRKKTAEVDQTLKTDLEQLVNPTMRGDPESPLRWTCKSVRRLADELKRIGHQTSHRMVASILHELGYSLQANSKTLEGSSHPDRDAQFGHINRLVEEYQATGDPVISVDTKKKELVGEFKNGGRELRPQGTPERVKVHDFVIPELGRAIPYGVYDLANNRGWVSVGTDHDTASFAVETIRRWWRSMGLEAFPDARRLLITADGGGSNGARLRLWKIELQQLANELGIPISVCHLPPGTSKWNKIEHRLFSFISQNWRGKPLVSHQVIVNLIAATTTKTGLKVRAEIDTRKYPPGRKITRQEVKKVRLSCDSFHGEWNYTIRPMEEVQSGTVIL